MLLGDHSVDISVLFRRPDDGAEVAGQRREVPVSFHLDVSVTRSLADEPRGRTVA